jgi:hypothetical protein
MSNLVELEGVPLPTTRAAAVGFALAITVA